MEIKIDYEPIKWAQEFHVSPTRHCLLVGGLGSGKTTAMVEELKALALENPGFTYLIGRKTLPALRDTTMKTFFSRMESGLIRRFNKANNIVTLINGSEFIFRPLDDMEKMKSLEIGGFGVDEANEITLDMYSTLKSRVRQKVGGKEPTMYRDILSMNPGEEDHWIPQLFLHVKPRDHQMFTSTTLDNLKNLPEGYIEELKANYTPDMQQRMIYGLFGKVHKGRPVFPQFARGNYVSPIEFDPKVTLIRSWDFGFNHPAVVFMQVINKQVRVLAELQGKEIYLEDFVDDEVLPFQESLFGSLKVPPRDFCDPRGSDQTDKGKSSVQILNDKRIYPVFRRTWIEEGIKAIKECMDTKDINSGFPNFLIHPRCKIAIEGYRGGYARLDGEETPNKDNYYDHIQDAIRYGVIHALQRIKVNQLNAQVANIKTHVSKYTGYRKEF